MNMQEEKTVAELVAEDINRAHVFKKFGIDFCCGGGISVAKAAEKKGVDLNNLLSELFSSPDTQSINNRPNTWSLGLLVDYIVQNHHQYVSDSISILNQYGEKVCKVHGTNHSVLFEIKHVFDSLAAELQSHMMKEERILFPYIVLCEDASRQGKPIPVAPFGSVNNPINMMTTEHDMAGDLCRRISELTMEYTPPSWACNTFKAYYARLRDFENDLHIHIHLENNILFPKAIALCYEASNK